MSPQQAYAEAPSNIALIKYWGKDDASLNWPTNDSISMTLPEALSKTTVENTNCSNDQIFLNEKEISASHSTHAKLQKYITFLKTEFSINDALLIRSENTFPTGCGLASSASGYAALTKALYAYATKFGNPPNLDNNDLANYSRRGSGSSCRSFMSSFVHWHRGQNPEDQKILEIPFHPEMELADTIAIVSNQEKAIPSTQAHRYVHSSPLFKPRLAALSEKIRDVKTYLAENQFDLLAKLVEQEAIEIHSVSMTATPPVTYLTQDSLDIISWVRQLRFAEGMEVFFTIDAGPNIHILTRKRDQKTLRELLTKKFPHIMGTVP